MTKFSLLMSIYYKEKPEYFNRTMQCIWDEQILKPNEIILVQDGLLGDDLNNIIKIWKEKLGELFTIISLETNLGLGDALNIGLNECSYKIVARMDTDDIALPERFQKQIKFLNKHPEIDIASSWISEFDKDENEILSIRRIPTNHKDIMSFSKKRCPMNHPAVIFRKDAVLKVGGYKRMIGFEDYYLWVRMLENGSKFLNIPEPLVHMRADSDQIGRRRGVKYAFREIKFQNVLLKIGHINIGEYIRNLFIRINVRIMPTIFVKFIYKKIRSINA